MTVTSHYSEYQVIKNNNNKKNKGKTLNCILLKNYNYMDIICSDLPMTLDESGETLITSMP